MDINFRAAVRLTRALLSTLIDHPGSHIVNLSSLFGLLAPVSQTAYAASKFAVRGWSEALRGEVRGHGIGVTTVHPGGIRTGIAARARVAAALDPDQFQRSCASFERSLRYPPHRAATEILDGVARRRARVLVGTDAKALDVLVRLFPTGHQRLLDRATRALF